MFSDSGAQNAPKDPGRDAARLSAELETALVRQLLRAWHDINRVYFKGALTPPTIELSSSVGRLGRWIAEVRAIEISRQLATSQPFGVVLEVLKHEVAHQYVHEGLREVGETAHGPAFQKVCQRLGIDATAFGMPQTQAEGKDEGDSGEERILARIARLLALAESPNVHEAEAAMKAAQRLMLKYNLEVGHSAKERGYGFRHLGAPRRRVSESERLVAMILSRHFFVEVIWVRSYDPLLAQEGTVLEVCGTPANLELSAHVHSFLSQTAERLWLEHKRKLRVAGDRDRRTYLAGVMLGFHEKLSLQQKESQTEGLVWVQDADLRDFYRRRHPYIRTTRQKGSRRTEAHEQGREAGRGIVLHRPVSARGGAAEATGAGSLLLPGKQR